MEGLIVIIALVVGITIIWSIRGIYVACHNCYVTGSTKGFFSEVWDGCGGNIFVILGLLILCIPVYFILKIIISIKKNNIHYRVNTRLTGDQRYRDAWEELRYYYYNGMGYDEARLRTVNSLVGKGVNQAEAGETVTYLQLALAVSNK